MKAKTLIIIIILALVVGAIVGFVSSHFFEMNPVITGVIATAVVVPISIGIVKVANEKDESRK